VQAIDALASVQAIDALASVQNTRAFDRGREAQVWKLATGRKP
jgi:hypothetical protein